MARQLVRYVPPRPSEVAAARARQARRRASRIVVVALAMAGLVAVPIGRADAVTDPRTVRAEAAAGAAPVTQDFPIHNLSV